MWIPFFYYATRNEFNRWWRIESINYRRYEQYGEFSYYDSLNERLEERIRIQFLPEGPVIVSILIEREFHVVNETTHDPDPDNDHPDYSRKPNSSNFNTQNAGTTTTIDNKTNNFTASSSSLSFVYVGKEGETSEKFGQFISQGLPRSFVLAFYHHFANKNNENEEIEPESSSGVYLQNCLPIMHAFDRKIHSKFGGKMELLDLTENMESIKNKVNDLYFCDYEEFPKEIYLCVLMPKHEETSLQEFLDNFNNVDQPGTSKHLKKDLLPTLKIESVIDVKNVLHYFDFSAKYGHYAGLSKITDWEFVICRGFIK